MTTGVAIHARSTGRSAPLVAVVAVVAVLAVVDPVKLSPPAGAIVLDKGNKASFAVARPAGVDTAYFFASSAAPASAGAVTYMK